MHDLDFDAIVIGAGVGGIAHLYRLKALGLRVRVFETGTGVGGAWYWNRYPGARVDSESYSYGFSFTDDVLKEWTWSEHFAAQPETERYINFVVDRLDLRGDIQFRSRVASAHYIDEDAHWRIQLESGEHYTARFVFAAVGPLTVPVKPRIEGIDTYLGPSFHTARWPREGVDFSGKRVAVIGTGASGVQTIQEAAKTAQQLTVFQRTANYCVPLNNSAVTDEQQQDIRNNLAQIFETCGRTFNGFLHAPDPRSALDFDEEALDAEFQRLYDLPGMSIWMGNFHDVLTDPAANQLISDFVKKKIRQRVTDPAVAELLVPSDHGFGTRRVPLETRYFEVYNQPNVRLVDLKATPIESITSTGIRTSAESFDFDMIVYATGFDAILGSFDKIDIQGRNGVKLIDKWRKGPSNYLGIMTTGFPNFFTPGGPLSALGNIPRALDFNAEWLTALVAKMQASGQRTVEPRQAAEDAWVQFSRELFEDSLGGKVDSWYTGVNKNLDNRQDRVLVHYKGGVPIYRERSRKEAEAGYPNLVFDAGR